MGFESNLGLRFFLCPLMVDSLHPPLFPLYKIPSYIMQGITSRV